MFSNILDFEVKVATKDGKTSQIIDYLDILIVDNPKMAAKCIANLTKLPEKIYAKQDIKPIKTGKIKFWELKIQSASDICRFFFIVEKPNIIVLYGFTKKTQKTEQKGLNMGEKLLLEYQSNPQNLSFRI